MIGTSGDAPVHLPNPVDWPHCYVIGATRSGKSTLIQVMVHTVMRDAVAVIDPDGRMCSEMVRWREWVGNHRLVYFNPTFKRGMTPCINPLEPVGVDPEDTSERAVHVKQLLAQQLMEALTQVIAGGQGSNVTLPMRSILMPCILTLLYRPGSTLRDLQRFMFRNEAEKPLRRLPYHGACSGA